MNRRLLWFLLLALFALLGRGHFEREFGCVRKIFERARAFSVTHD